MTHTVYYTGEFVPVERSVRKLDRIVDVWLRRNPREDSDELKMADELYIQFTADNAPSYEYLQAHIDDYFTADATPETTLQDAIDAINVLSDIIFGGGL